MKFLKFALRYLVTFNVLFISLVAELEDTFDVTIPAVEIIPDNFNSAEAMLEMLQRLRED